jgi:predicted RNA-binding Zn-ribbon protein involved in translation (DUF1610 family)
VQTSVLLRSAKLVVSVTVELRKENAMAEHAIEWECPTCGENGEVVGTDRTDAYKRLEEVQAEHSMKHGGSQQLVTVEKA